VGIDCRIPGTGRRHCVDGRGRRRSGVPRGRERRVRLARDVAATRVVRRDRYRAWPGRRKVGDRGGSTMGPARYFPGATKPREGDRGFVGRDLAPRLRLPESLSWSRAGSDPVVSCLMAVLPSKLEEPGRRIGQRGDATRAPTQVPRPGRAAGRRPSASRDWPQSDKSIYNSCRHRLARRATSFSPFLLNQHRIPYACSSMVLNRDF
jgi:hypothetical protein